MERKFLTLGASLRKGSFNKKLAQAATGFLKQQSVDVSYREFNDFDVPLFNEDTETDDLPAGAQKFVEALSGVECVVVSVPEYNGSISGVLKNLLDWTSRAEKNPLKGKKVLLLSASPGALGGVRGLWHTRVPFEALGCFVYPEMFGLPKAHEALNEQNEFTDAKTGERLKKLLGEFLRF